jgi:microcystin-dependent protein
MSPSAISPTGGGQPHQNVMPYLAVNFIISLEGIFPSRN